MKSILILSVVIAVVSCQQPQKSEQTTSHLGELNYEFSISDAAKPHFDEGLLLLHSFEYDDARTAFKKAVEADPSEMMARWGEAMTHYKALWRLQDVDAGRAVIEQLGETKEERLTKAENELEKDFWTSIEILYGEGEFYERNKAYADHMGELYDKYEGNQEVAAFYSLGLMWSVPLGRDEEILKRSATVAAGILEENPNHPGALHYVIHAYDDPEFATFAVDAADIYAQVAPDAAHALHMPSHIYLQLGRWNDVVASNETSYGASVRRMERMDLGDAARGFHSFRWLHYGYLQQGRFEKAEELLRDMQTYTASAQTGSAKYYLIEMQTSQLIETGAWSLDIEPMEVEISSLGAFGAQAFFKSMMAYQAKDPSAIKEQMSALDEKLAAAELLVTDQGIAMCSAGQTRNAPNKNSLITAEVRLRQMQGLIDLLNGDEASAEQQMTEATELEAQLPYASGPANIAYPSFEMYGDWLLERGRFEEALAQFNTSLERAPNRAMALHGKIKAATELGLEDEVTDAEDKLAVFWRTSELTASL